MTRVIMAFPGDLSAQSGGYAYDRRIVAGLNDLGLETIPLSLPGAFPHPGEAEVAFAVQAIRQSLRQGDIVLADGLALGAMSPAAIEAIGASVIALCHHPLALEAGLAPKRRRFLRDSEQQALAAAAHVIVTSSHTRAILMRDYSVGKEKISVAVPGADSASRASGSRGPTTELLAVGAIIPRKAYDVLARALSQLKNLDWRLRIVGDADASPATVTALSRLIEAEALSNRITLLGGLRDRELEKIFATSDLFVSASLFEGYGMALAEAMARGLPIVMSTGGAAGDVAPDEAALKVGPGDCGALGAALRAAITDRALRQKLAEASWRAGQTLPGWPDAAKIVAQAAQRLAALA